MDKRGRPQTGISAVLESHELIGQIFRAPLAIADRARINGASP
jgi:hypothetical protein